MTRKEIERLRAVVLERSKSVPDGEQVKLPIEILKQLIFEPLSFREYLSDKQKNELDKAYKENGYHLSLEDVLDREDANLKRYLVPVWTGDFLRKLDLSDLPFDDVVLDINVLQNVLNFIIRGRVPKEFNDKLIFSFVDAHFGNLVSLRTDLYCGAGSAIIYELTGRGYILDFANTNIPIDFTRIASRFSTVVAKSFQVFGANFSNVDLKNSNIDSGLVKLSSCNLCGTNLSGRVLDIKNFDNCNFEDSGANIIIPVDEKPSKYNTLSFLGCFVNGEPFYGTPEFRDALESIQGCFNYHEGKSNHNKI